MRAPISRRLLVRAPRMGAPSARAERPIGGLCGDLGLCEAVERGMDTSADCLVVNSDALLPAPAMDAKSLFPAVESSSGHLALFDSDFTWVAFRRRYEARYLGAFNADFIRFLISQAPHFASRLACFLAVTNPRHAARIIDIFGESHFQLGGFASRTERSVLAHMVTHPSLSPTGSVWLFNEIQRHLADWSCESCGSLNVSSASKCKKCDSCSNLWSCAGCGLVNRGVSVFCEGCGQGDRAVRSTAFRWRCACCSFINPTASLACARCAAAVPVPAFKRRCSTCSIVTDRSCFPWCGECGADEHNGRVRLWSCRWCSSENSTLTPSCMSCGEARAGAVSRAWYQWSCSECGAKNPFWSAGCRCCASKRPAAESLAATKCGLCGAPTHSGVLCPLCISSSRWVCISEACAGVNSAEETSCGVCGVTPLFMLNDDMLKWSPTNTRVDGVAIALSVSALSCVSCNCSIPPLMFSCPQCSLVQPPQSRIHSWVVLRALHGLSQEYSAHALDSQKCNVALRSIEAACESLCLASNELLPWTGVDIESGVACETSSSPVNFQGNAHFGIRTLRDVLRFLISACSQDSCGASQKRIALDCCLDLVELSNRSTEFDEIGFDILRELTLALRPLDIAVIDSEMRIRYLLNMKLSRADIVGGASYPRGSLSVA